MQLKPHDTAVGLKYGCIAMGADAALSGDRVTIRELSDALGLSPGEISKSNQRLLKAKLIAPVRDSYDRQPEFNTVTRHMREWISYGIPYSIIVEPQGLGNGLVTSWSNPEINSEFVAPEIPSVWLTPNGSAFGEGISPMYTNAVIAASRDANMHYALSLIDAIRLGKPRELKIARTLLEDFFERMNNAQQLHKREQETSW